VDEETRDGVQEAIAEHDAIGAEALLAKPPFLLYVPKHAVSNIEIAVREGVWGEPHDAAENLLSHLTPPRTGRDVLGELRVGDLVLAAGNGPTPRVPKGGWSGVVIGDAVIWKVTEPYHYSETSIWPVPAKSPTEKYPHRFGIEEVGRLQGVDRSIVGVEGMDALWYSANNRSVVLPPVADAPLPEVILGVEADDPELRRVLADLGESLDAPTVANYRREQSKLRYELFGTRAVDTCALCGRELPVGLLHAAHIKRRSKCTDGERLELANVMRACTLGCDHLFELGCIYVDATGEIRRGKTKLATAALDAAVARLAGTRCSAHTDASEPYFEWHRNNLLT
jgi:hypothetical protein